jgi:hypothetical protein
MLRAWAEGSYRKNPHDMVIKKKKQHGFYERL